MNPRVFVLTMVTFAFGSAAFIFAGLLETMAADLGSPPPSRGNCRPLMS